jgi:sugar fermentation stimulation protein A
VQVEYGEIPRAGRFVERVNRFVARVIVGGREVLAHVPSSGRMAELLYPGAQVYVLAKGGAPRKTPVDLILARQKGVLVSVDARLPNRLVCRSLEEGRFPFFPKAVEVEQEVNFGSSRMDFRIKNGGETCFLEVKSVTLVQDGRAIFPDAPTSRGTRHLAELALARQEGHRAIALFIVQRNDAHSFSPNWETDRDFAAGLVQAAAAGVEVYAYDCTVTLEGVSLGVELPVVLS